MIAAVVGVLALAPGSLRDNKPRNAIVCTCRNELNHDEASLDGER